MSAADRRLTALILAGSRGPDDPVARHAGQTHKALVPVAGVPMLLRVVRTLRQAPCVGRLALCIDRPTLEQLHDPDGAELLADIRIIEPGKTPSADQVQKIQAAIASIGTPDVQAASNKINAWVKAGCHS